MSRSRVGSIVIRCLLLAAAILASCSNGFAQVASSISGRIEDPSAAAWMESNRAGTTLA